MNLKKTYDEALNRVNLACEEYPWEDKDHYSAWLAQSYYFVCHSTRLLGAAAARFKVDRNKLHLRCGAHIQEERSHEVLAFRDLHHLGYRLDDFPELPITAAFYQSQYYLIEHEDPISLQGYILFLEGLAVVKGPYILGRAMKAHGEKAVSYLKLHVEEDQSHLETAFKQLEGLSPDDLCRVERGLRQAADLYEKILLDLQSPPTAKQA